MNSDLPPFSAFALESFQSIRVASDVQTMTLRLDLAPTAQGPVAGQASIALAVDPAPAAQVQRAAVVPFGGSALTITF